MHYYQHHIGDFIRDTSRLSDEQCMAYLRMIWLYYESEQPLPNNARSLAFRVGSSVESVQLILESFFRLDGDAWRHTRCDLEISEYQAICIRNRTNGKSGGRPKKTQPVSDGLPEETQTEPHRNPNQYPVTSNQEDQKPLSPDGDESGKKISYADIAELYNRVCGDVLPRCVALNAKRKTNIRNLCSLTINGDKPFRDLDFWEGYFNDCLTNKHWTGQNDRGWRADLEFLTRQEVALKALEAA
jgi:uncharacterized protein YdaU (DUF1376 family)